MAIEVGKINYEANFDNAHAVAKDCAQCATAYKNSGIVYTCGAGDYATTTGYYYAASLYNLWVQTTSGLWLEVNTNDPQWSFTTNDTKLATKSSASAQKLVNIIIENDKLIIANNLVCARFVSKLTTEQKKKLYDLQARLQARNNALLDDGLIASETTGTPAGYNHLESYLDSFMESGGVGSVSITAVVVTAVVVAALGTAAYWTYKDLADESAADVKYSDELTKILTEKLTDEEYALLLEETGGIVTKAKLKAKLGSNLKVIYVLALGLGGWLIYNKFFKK